MDSQTDDVEHLFKIVLIGDSEVGKSNVLLRFTKNTFSAECRTTIGVEFSAKKLTVDGTCVKIQLWDTAGQEKFRAITKAYYRGAVGAILVYDVTKKKSFESIERWYTEIKEWADSPNIVIMMIGNKVDLDGQREVTKEEAILFAETNKMGFVETSAKSGINIDFAFKKIVEEILRHVKQLKGSEDNIFESEIAVEKDDKQNSRISKNMDLVRDRQDKPKSKQNDGCC